MSLLGIDIGTSGCKVSSLDLEGKVLASAAEEYQPRHDSPGQAELESQRVWQTIQNLIREVVHQCPQDPISAISSSSLGEAVVPVRQDREILANSILNFDSRGAGYLDDLAKRIEIQDLYARNGNTLGNNYSLTKLLWIKNHQPDLFERTDYFLHWSGFAAYMLGAEAAIDYSLANRTLLFNLDLKDWDADLLAWAGLEASKLPPVVPAATPIGQVSASVARNLGLKAGIPILAGAHDQNVNAVGCGAVTPGLAAFSMGTFHCLTPIFARRPAPEQMLARGLNIEHHAVPGQYVSFLYNQGGSLVRWFRDTFARAEILAARKTGQDIYELLIAEIPEKGNEVIVLPHFTTTGPPDFLEDSCGVISGLRLETQRGDILSGILKGIAFYIKELVDSLPETGISIKDIRATGGGSRSDRWVQTYADILQTPIARPRVSEAGALGAAMLAGIGSGAFASFEEASEAMVQVERRFEPDPATQEYYEEQFSRYKRLSAV